VGDASTACGHSVTHRHCGLTRVRRGWIRVNRTFTDVILSRRTSSASRVMTFYMALISTLRRVDLVHCTSR